MASEITEKEAAALMERKIVYVEDVEWDSISIVVEGITYTLEVRWKPDPQTN